MGGIEKANMGKTYECIDDTLASWIGAQRMYFVATAPLAREGHVNCSPKGGDTLRVLGSREIAYLDGIGSGIETISHLRENGRIVVMLCAFEGPPRILRLHGRGTVIDTTHAEFAPLVARFCPYPTARAIVRIAVSRIADSCGYGVPFYEFRAERAEPHNLVRKTTDRVLKNYLGKVNRVGIDGLPALSPEAIDGTVIRRP
jgi:hypothetical protein